MKIVVRVCNWIGDVVMNVSALELLRRRYPHATIVAVARPWVAEILAFRPDLVDRFIAYDDKGADRGLLGLWRISRRIRQERFDLAVVFTKHFKGAAMMWLAGVAQRVGFAKLETKLFLNLKVPFNSLPGSGRHQSFNYSDLVTLALDLEQQAVAPPRLDPPTALLNEVKQNFLQAAVGPVLAVHAGAAYGTAKRWPAQRYAELCKRFIQTYGGTVVLLGVAAEAEVNQTIYDHLPAQAARNLCGQTKLNQSLALIAACDLFLSNDSGLMHAAAAFKTPQLAVFGPTDIHATFPLSPRAATVQHQVDCSPCFERHCPLKHHQCMQGLTLGKVWRHFRQTAEQTAALKPRD